MALGFVAEAAGCRGDDGGASQRIFVATLDELRAGEAIEFELPDAGPCFVIQLEGSATMGVGPESSIVAFSSICPHMGCPLGVSVADPNAGTFGPCGCHQSMFDLRNDGRMVYGRASVNLPRIELELVGDEVFALRSARLCYGAPLTDDYAHPGADGSDEDRSGR